MPISPEVSAAFDAITEEIALSLNDALVATTNQQKLAAKARFKAAMRAHGLFILRNIRFGVCGSEEY